MNGKKSRRIDEIALGVIAQVPGRYWRLVALGWAGSLARAIAIAAIAAPGVIASLVSLGLGAWVNAKSPADASPTVCAIVFAVCMVVAFVLGPWPDWMLNREVRRVSEALLKKRGKA